MRRYAFHEPLTALQSQSGLVVARATCSRCGAKAKGASPVAERALYQALSRLDRAPACVPVTLDEHDFPLPAA